MGAIQVEVKILHGRAPVLVTWENPAKKVVESLLVTCECQGLKLDGYTKKHREWSTEAESILHAELMASNLAHALERADVVTSTSLDHLESLANNLNLSDDLVTPKDGLRQMKHPKRSRRESRLDKTDDGAILSSHSSQDESTSVDNQLANLAKRRKKRRPIKFDLRKKKRVDPQAGEDSGSGSKLQLNSDPVELSPKGKATTSLVEENAEESKLPDANIKENAEESKLPDADIEMTAADDSGTKVKAGTDQIEQSGVNSDPNQTQVLSEMRLAIPPETQSIPSEVLPEVLPEAQPLIPLEVPPGVLPETQPAIPEALPEVPPETQPVVPPEAPPEISPETLPEIPEVPPETQPGIPPEVPPEISPEVTPEMLPEIPPEIPTETKNSYIVVIDAETDVVVGPALLTTDSVSSSLPSVEAVTNVVSDILQSQGTSVAESHGCSGMATGISESDIAGSFISSEMGTLSTAVHTHTIEDIRNLSTIKDSAKVKVIRNLTEEERKKMFQFRSDCEKKNRHELERSGTKAYLCEQCGKVLSHGTRKRHLETHMADRARNNVCEVCGKGFHSREGLKHHQEVHDDRKTFDCRYCPRQYKTMYGRTRHERLHFAIQPEKCKTCGEKFKDLADLKNHLKSVHKQEGTEKTTRVGRRRGRPSHLEILHAGHADTTSCRICNKVVRNSTLPGHLQRHEGKMFTCPLCGKVMAELSKYSHMRLHTGQKDHKCTYCEKAFANGPSLKVHMRIHTGERPIKCRHCDRGFSRHSSREVHEASHTGERPFKCTICNKSWKDRPSYGTHMKKNHPGEPLVYKRLSAQINSQQGKLSTHVEVIDVNQILDK